jgi:murein L,D-transpeptidase YcbB/YkuD
LDIRLLKRYLEADNSFEFTNIIQPSSIEYHSLLKRLNQFTTLIKSNSFKEVPIISTKINNDNVPLLIRLYQLGITDSVGYTFSEKVLAAKVKEALELFGVLNDGALRKTSIAALNVPLSKRIKELKLAMNNLRWLEGIKQAGTIAIVNIPSATLLVYDHGMVILDLKVIVGKSTTPTPMLNSTITEVIVYPY